MHFSRGFLITISKVCGVLGNQAAIFRIFFGGFTSATFWLFGVKGSQAAILTHSSCGFVITISKGFGVLGNQTAVFTNFFCGFMNANCCLSGVMGSHAAILTHFFLRQTFEL